MEEAQKILQKYWGYSSFRSPQEEVISSVLEGHDTVALLPTGAGKSLCFQVPALMMEGKTLVISPLIALMQDQVDQLFTRGIKARALHSHLSFREIDAILDNFVFGDMPLLYVSPERLASELFQARISKVKLDLLAIDESHCISQWGYDFRPAYLNIAALREIHPNTPILALTATATPKVLEDICRRLEMKKPVIFTKSFARTNLSFSAFLTDDKEKELLLVLTQTKGTAVIYVRNRKETLTISTWLQKKGISCLPYHGGMDKSDREKNQQAWMTGKVRVIACTNAFGMGIDKGDVRMVIHLDVPASLEEYYQEAGRAGRDGQPSIALALISAADVLKATSALEDQFPSVEQIAFIFEKLCRFYKIAYGSGELETFDISMYEIAGALSMPLKKVFHTIQILEKEGWILLSEGMKQPSMVKILADREDLLYSEQFGREKAEVLIQMLRSYEGIQTLPVHIDEQRLAKSLFMEEKKLSSILYQLHSEGYIDYRPKSENPRITFLRPRPRDGQFYMDRSAYAARKKQALVRMQSMIQYLQQENSCRQQAILSYFGEKSTACGQCDLCQGTLRSGITDETAQRIWIHLRETTRNQNVHVKSYIAQYPIFHRRRMMNLFRQWANEGSIGIDPMGKISIRQHG